MATSALVQQFGDEEPSQRLAEGDVLPSETQLDSSEGEDVADRIGTMPQALPATEGPLGDTQVVPDGDTLVVPDGPSRERYETGILPFREDAWTPDVFDLAADTHPWSDPLLPPLPDVGFSMDYMHVQLRASDESFNERVEVEVLRRLKHLEDDRRTRLGAAILDQLRNERDEKLNKHELTENTVCDWYRHEKERRLKAVGWLKRSDAEVNAGQKRWRYAGNDVPLLMIPISVGKCPHNGEQFVFAMAGTAATLPYPL